MEERECAMKTEDFNVPDNLSLEMRMIKNYIELQTQVEVITRNGYHVCGNIIAQDERIIIIYNKIYGRKLVFKHAISIIKKIQRSAGKKGKLIGNTYSTNRLEMETLVNIIEREKKVRIILQRGLQMNGIIICQDENAIIFDDEVCQQIIYKDAISTIADFE